MQSNINHLHQSPNHKSIAPTSTWAFQTPLDQSKEININLPAKRRFADAFMNTAVDQKASDFPEFARRLFNTEVCSDKYTKEFYDQIRMEQASCFDLIEAE